MHSSTYEFNRFGLDYVFGCVSQGLVRCHVEDALCRIVAINRVIAFSVCNVQC